MIKLSEAVVVEGRYDKIKLSGLIDAVIISTGGYRIFKDKAALEMIKKIAAQRGLIIFTDSDAAGFRIRRYLKGAVPGELITNVYLPQIKGKEPRKENSSAEGYLGVEGVDDAVILQALAKAGVRPVDEAGPHERANTRPVTKTDFVLLGLSGSPDSAARRKAVLDSMGMPPYLSAGAMIELINATMDYDSFITLVGELF